MHPAIFDTETVRFTFVLGIVLSIWLYDRLHITSGSIVAPTYLALNLYNPAALIATALNVLVAHTIVYRLLPRFVLLQSREKFLILIPVSIALQMLAHEVGAHWGDVWVSDLLLVSIGYVIPGLIAHDIATQGVRNTLMSVGGIGIVIGTVAFLVALFTAGAAPETAQIIESALSFQIRWFHFAMLFSVLASIALLYNHGLRAGGFVGAAYVSLFAVKPTELLFVGVLALATYVLVTRVLMPHLIIFGRRKFAAMLLVATVLSWGTLLLREQIPGFGGLPLSSSAFALISLTLTGLFANDMERVGIERVLRGTVLSVLFTLSATLLVVQGNENGDPAIMLPLALLAGVTGWIIFKPQLCALLSSLTDHKRAVGAHPVPARAMRSQKFNASEQRGGVLIRGGWGIGHISFVLFVGAIGASLSLAPPIRDAQLVVRSGWETNDNEAIASGSDPDHTMYILANSTASAYTNPKPGSVQHSRVGVNVAAQKPQTFPGEKP